jgi:hypothetical protein
MGLFCFSWILASVALAGTDAAPVDLLLLLEHSGGMEEHIDNLRIDAAGPGDRIAVMTFDRKIHMRADFTSDREKTAGQIRRLGRAGRRVGIGTPLSRATGSSDVHLLGRLVEAAEVFRTQPAAPGRKRIVLVLFGSEDFSSKPTPKEVTAALQDAHIRLFGIAVRRFSPGGGARPDAQTPPTIPGPTPPVRMDHLPLPEMTLKALSGVARETGGEVFAHQAGLSKIFELARRP